MFLLIFPLSCANIIYVSCANIIYANPTDPNAEARRVLISSKGMVAALTHNSEQLPPRYRQKHSFFKPLADGVQQLTMEKLRKLNAESYPNAQSCFMGYDTNSKQYRRRIDLLKSK